MNHPSKSGTRLTLSKETLRTLSYKTSLRAGASVLIANANHDHVEKTAASVCACGTTAGASNGNGDPAIPFCGNNTGSGHIVPTVEHC